VGRIRRVVAGGVATLLVGAALAAAAIPRDGGLQGTTSQLFADGSAGRVAIGIARHGHRLRSFDITWLAPCDSGFTPLSQGTHARGPVSRRGKFKGHGRYFSDQGNLAGTQYTATISDRLQGRFIAPGKAKGSFQATAVLRDAGGRPVSTCTSPVISWRASS
jgi:hypothetical protein